MKRFLVFLFGALLACGASIAATGPADTLNVTNIAALRALGSAASQYPNVVVGGYYTQGDGGGGLFKWSGTSTATAEPCVTFAATGVGTGRYLRQLNGQPLSVLGCGVKADSSTDNSTNLQAAFNAISTYNLGEIYCPASSGTIKFGTSIAPVGGGSLRGQLNTLNPSLGSSSNAPGACHFVYTAASGWAFDFQTPFQSIAPCPSVTAPRFYDFTLEQASTGNGFRINNLATAGFSDDCVGTGGGQSVVTGAVFDGIVTNSSQRGTIGIQLNKGFDTTISNSYFSFYDTQVDVEGSDNVLQVNNKYNFATVQAILIHAHGTYGNFDSVRDSTFFSVTLNAPYFINSSARSGVIDGNYFEDDFGGNTAIFNITCALAQTITNNAIETNSTLSTYWIKVSGDCTSLRLENNYNGGSLLPPANFNAGLGSHWFANSTKQVIIASGNPRIVTGIPFITRDTQPGSGVNAPAISGSILASFDASSPQDIGGNYSTAIYIGPANHNGDFEFQPQNAPNGHVNFTFSSPVTGAIDLWVLAYTGGGSNQVLTVTDGVSTTTTTLSSGTTPTWYKVITNDTVTNPTIDTYNNDVVHGQFIYITRWQAVKH